MVDVEKIMQDIRNEIKEKGLDKEILNFEPVAIPKSGQQYDCFDYLFFLDNVDKINRTCLIQPNKPVGGNVIARFVKKAIRKLTRFYVAPIVCDQSEFNVYVTRVVNSLRYYVDEEKKDKENIEELTRRIELLEKKLANSSLE